MSIGDCVAGDALRQFTDSRLLGHPSRY